MDTIQKNVHNITKNMSRDELVKEIELLAEAFTDLVDGESYADIMDHGFEEIRALEIVGLGEKYLQG